MTYDNRPYNPEQAEPDGFDEPILGAILVLFVLPVLVVFGAGVLVGWVIA